jgi:sigma-B regulation protein RsbU (phosphoserine phosphatase)
VSESRILIVDDNPDMIYLIRRGFVGQGYEIYEAHDGDEALQIMGRSVPDLVLLDLKMPRMYGISVIEAMREDPSLRDVPIIVLTVVDDAQEKISALRAGANDFLLKPPLTEELKARVSTHLKLREATKALIEHSKHLEEIVAQKTEDLKEYATRLEEMVEEKVGVIKRQNEELLTNIESAHKIQHDLLPKTFPGVPGVDFTIRYRPYLAVGGDFYDVFRIDEDTIGLFIADVSGHGVPSAMVTIFLKQEVRRTAKGISDDGSFTVTRPREVLDALNTAFISMDIGEGAYFVTMVYCTYHIGSRRLECSNAGHHALPLLRRHDGRIESIEIPGFPVGWFKEDTDYREIGYDLHPGDTLYLFTDGLLELIGDLPEDGDYLKHVGEFLRRREDPMEAFDVLLAERKEEENLRDDVTLLSFSLRAAP